MTPEGVRILLTPAGPYKRAVAWAADVGLWVATMGTVIAMLPHSRLSSGVFAIVLFFTYWFYPILCEVYWDGRTLGKRMTGLRVVRADGLPVGWRESVLRNLLLVADFLPFMYTSGLLCMMFDSQFRRIGDLVAGTLVIYHERPGTRVVLVHAAPLAPPFPLSADQQRTLAELFEREHSLPPERMRELGTIASALTGLEGAESIERLRAYTAGFSR